MNSIKLNSKILNERTDSLKESFLWFLVLILKKIKNPPETQKKSNHKIFNKQNIN